MAACIHCKTESQFLTFDALGLCHNCSPDHAPIIAEVSRGQESLV